MFAHTARVAPESQSHRLLAAVPFRGGQGEDMATKGLTYKEQLLHPNWQRKRLEMLDAAGFKCTLCNAGEKTLHVHHKSYIKGRMAWEYEDGELEVLCEDCHEAAHESKDQLDAVLRLYPTFMLDSIQALLIGWGCDDGVVDQAHLVNVTNKSPYLTGKVAWCLMNMYGPSELLEVCDAIAALSPDDLLTALRTEVRKGMPDA